MSLDSVSPQLSFALGNADAADTIYITSDPKVNKLTLSISATAEAHFVGGSVVPPAQAPAGTSSLLYLNLSKLQIPTAAFQQITCQASGWQYALYPESDLIGLAPVADFTLKPDDKPLSIQLDNLTLPNPPSSPNANLNVSYYRVTPLAEGPLSRASFFKVLLQAAPGGHANLHDAISCQLTTPPYVCNSLEGLPPVSNNLSFVLQPARAATAVVAGPNTHFTVSFVYAPAAPGYGALTTPARAGQLRVKQGQNAAAWTVTPNASAENPSWTLTPPQDKPIVGTGTEALVEFDMDNIVTDFEPGPTLMFVQYQGVPGYDDGFYYLVLSKIAHVNISALTVEPMPAVLKDGSTKVTVRWQASDATMLQLMPFYQDVTGRTEFEAKLSDTTLITLVATGKGEGNTLMRSVTADVLPSINSFSGQPGAVHINDFPHEARFYWSVDTNRDVLLIDDTTGSQALVSSSGNTTRQLSGPGMWSLTPKGVPSLMRNVLIPAFQAESATTELSFTPVAVAASPTAQFVAAVNQQGGTVYVLNSLNFTDYTNPITVGAGPVDAVFTKSGDYLLVANGAGKSVSVIQVSYDAGTSQYQFTLQKTVSLDFTPRRLALSPDGNFLFVSALDSEHQGQLLVIDAASGSFGVKQQVAVGTNPGGIAVDPSSLRLYVANAGDNSVSVLGYSPLNKEFNLARTISGLSGQPVDVAVAGELGRTLLVVCTGVNQLVALSYDDAGTSPRKKLPLGSAPVAIATTPDRAYAFVANSQDNTVTLLSCGGSLNDCKVLGQPVPTGNTPAAVSVTSDSTGVFVANRGNSLTLLNLVNYTANNAAVPVGKYPTNVIAKADGSNVVSWHNVLNTSGTGPKKSPGIFVYEPLAGKVTTRLATNDITQVLLSPDTKANRLYALLDKNTSVSVVDATQYTVQREIPVPAGVGGAKRQPLALAMPQSAQFLYTLARDAQGGYSLLVYTCQEATNKYTVVADLALFTSTSSSNPVLLQCTPDGSNVLILSTIDKKIWVVARGADGNYALRSTPLVLPSLAKSMVTSPDNAFLYVLTQQGQTMGLSVANLATHAVSSYPMPHSYFTLMNLQQMSISPDGKRLFISDANIVGVRVMSTASRRIIQTLAWEQDVQYPMGIALLPDASALYLVGYNSGNLVQINQLA